MYQANGQKQQVRNPIHARVIQDKFTHYKASTVEDYAAKLKKMTVWDLNEEALRGGHPPSDNRARIERKLIEQYKKDKLSYDIAAGKYDQPDDIEVELTGVAKEMMNFAKS